MTRDVLTYLCLDDARHDALQLLALATRADALEVLASVLHGLGDRDVKVIVRPLSSQVLSFRKH